MSDEPVELPLVTAEATVREAVEAIDRSGKGIVLVVDGERRLRATITDGDVRRAVLDGFDLGRSVESLLAAGRGSRTPVTAPVGATESRLLALMQEDGLRHIPLLDEERRVRDLALLGDIVRDYELALTAVVMAGGFGRRLGDLTTGLPKPMLPVGERPLLERIVEQLRAAGIRTVNLTTHYRGEAIKQHFGDGSEFGVSIRYIEEDEPLGTAGALGLMDEVEEPVLVMNGDIVTRVDLRAMLEFHGDQQADMTVALRPYEVSVPYGVVDIDGETVVGITEKPLVRGFVNGGIYLLGRRACREIPRGRRFEMTDLVNRVLETGGRVVGFPLREYWLDIGRVEDYEQALLDAAADG